MKLQKLLINKKEFVAVASTFQNATDKKSFSHKLLRSKFHSLGPISLNLQNLYFECYSQTITTTTLFEA